MKKLHFLAVAIVFLLPLFCMSSDKYYDLDMQYYPDFFVHNNRLDLNFVVGQYADAGDVLALVDIASSLQDVLAKKLENGSSIFEVEIEGNSHDELTALYMDVLSKNKTYAAKTSLDTSFNISSIQDKNLLLVGGPCVNWVSAYFKGYPEDCTYGYPPGKGYIEIFRNGNGIVLLVAGYSVDDTKLAAQMLANYMDYKPNMVGTKVRISSAMLEELKIE